MIPSQTGKIALVAVLIPCLNEAPTIRKVIDDFKKSLPEADIYVYDNGSSDGTMEIASQAGAYVRFELQRGKGHVVRRMFQDVEADLYVLVDGDDTYDAGLARELVNKALEGPFDVVNAVRFSGSNKDAFRYGHQIGNRLMTGTVRLIFGNRVRDMLSGYKVLSRRFVKSFPSLSKGFEVETEMTVHALGLDLAIAHVEGDYRNRPEGSHSKLNSFRDGFRILFQILILFKQEKPFLLFTAIGSCLAILSLILGIPVVLEFIRTHKVLRLPTAVLATGIMLLGFLSVTAGLVLDSVSRSRKEMKRLFFLSHPPPSTSSGI